VTAGSKQTIRDHIWALLTKRHVARFPGAVGRIPNFVGAEVAARRLAESPAWQAARVVKCNPDAPQLPVRALALKQGKRVFMAVPRLREERCFLELDPRRLAGRERAAASIRGAGKLGKPTLPKDMPKIELIVAGSVAVRRDGARVGKGGGFSDLEFGLLVEAGLIDAGTPLTTTLHPSQVLDGELPETDHDFRVDRIVTPSEVIVTGAHRRPPGILWDHLDEEKIAAVPVLARLRRQRV